MPRIINIKNDGAAGQSGQLRVGQLIQAVEGTHTRGQYPEMMQLFFFRYMFTRLKTQGHSRPAVSDLPEWGVSQDEPYCSGAATKPHQHLQKCHVSTMKLFYYCGSCYNNNILNILLSLLNHIEISEREDWNDLPHVPEKDVSSNLLIENFTCTLRLRVPPPPTG